ncbi:ubiquitin-related domain-containing protein [Coniella lustricola]|uniref:Ubiquitin-related domain-containing protein n=1 Tax=Coniella lustricola TaxID=2025994 RepID=A0A2T3ABS9_9PEZI|nr:ubiquitin-related domain-containing protein [Coniella lustricola]
MDPAQQPSGQAKADPSTSTSTAAAAIRTPPPEEQQHGADAPAVASSSKGKEVVSPIAEHDRTDSLSIGAADEPSPNTAAEPLDGPVCNITLLLPTGARHPYKIDDRYLTKRNVEVPDMTESGKRDPFSISVYKLKELILREWRDEWDGKPASPSSIRLIHFGKLLDDKEQLRKYRFSADAPNVVHMSVKPAEMLEEDEAGKGKSTTSGGRSNEGGSGCCVIL